MIHSALGHRRVCVLGSAVALLVAAGCGSSADSSGVRGTANAGANGTSGSGNSVAGTGHGTAGTSSGQSGASAGGSSSAQGGEGNETGGSDSSQGGSGGRGDGNASGGASDGGESGSGEGGAGGDEPPEAWTQCVEQEDCVLTPATCCGQCGAVTPEDAAAVNVQYLGEFREAACGGPGICPACIAEDDPRVSTYCSEQGHCVVDLALD